MTVRRVVLAAVLLLVTSSIAVGATAPTPTAPPAGDEPVPLGTQVSAFMQASAAQATGTVGNGMWAVGFDRASTEAEQRAMVEGRVRTLNATLADLRAERRALLTAYQNGTIDRTTYQARLSALVGRLAAIGDGIDETTVRGRAVGVEANRLESLRSQARDLGGGDISRLARNLSGGHDPPGRAGVFDRGPPGQGDDRRPDHAGNRSTKSTGNDRGDGGTGGGPPTDRGQTDD